MYKNRFTMKLKSYWTQYFDDARISMHPFLLSAIKLKAVLSSNAVLNGNHLLKPFLLFTLETVRTE